MAKKIDHISLKKSTVLDKAPLAKDLVDGELAVNIAKDGEKIFLKNTASEIVEFSSDKLLNKKYLSTTSGGTVSGETTFTKDTTFDNIKLKYPKTDSEAVSLRDVMLENEKVTAAALNDLNERVNDHKSVIDTIKTQKYLPLSGGTVSGEATFTNDVKIAYPDSGSKPVSLRKVMADNEEVTAASLNDLNDKINNISIVNAPLIIKDGSKKYKLNLAKLITDKYAVEI